MLPRHVAGLASECSENARRLTLRWTGRQQTLRNYGTNDGASHPLRILGEVPKRRQPNLTMFYLSMADVGPTSANVVSDAG